MRSLAPSLAWVIVVGATISMLGYLASDTLSAPRVLFAFARDGFLPRRVGALHARTHAPYVAILLHAAVAFGLAVSGSFVELAILSSLATVLVYIVRCAAAVRLQRRATAQAGAPLRVRGLELAAGIGVLSMAWIAIHAAAAEALGCIAAVGIAVVWYALASERRRSRAAARS